MRRMTFSKAGRSKGPGARRIGVRVKPRRGDFGKCCIGLRPTRCTVADNADAVAALALPARKIEHVPKEPADRRPQHV
jgi:hypothetical protein